MALNKIPCPECSAGLKSASGFTVGQTVCCPKCETYFKVEEPAEDNEDAEENDRPKKGKASSPSIKTKAASAKKPIKAATISDDDDDEDEDDDDDEDNRPKKKKKKKKRRDDDDDDEERSYKNSPLRYALLGILVIVMLVLGYFLYQKYKKEHTEETADSKPAKTDPAPSGGQGQLPLGGRPKGPFIPQDANKKNGKGGGIPPGAFGPGAMFGPTQLPPAEKAKLIQKFRTQLVGTWKADLGDGVTAQIVYTADGKITETVTTSMGTQTAMGTWSVTDATSQDRLVVTIVRNGVSGTNKLVFEDDELQHPVFGQGVIGIFRKG
jgi:hypothetical protein